MKPRRSFLKSAARMGSAAAMGAMAAAAAPGGRTRVKGGIRVGNLFFSSGLTGTPASGVGEQTERILQAHKTNLEAIGSSLENVIKVTVYMADIKNEKPAMNEAYAKFFPKDAPARSAIGVQFPDDVTRLEIELVAWAP